MRRIVWTTMLPAAALIGCSDALLSPEAGGDLDILVPSLVRQQSQGTWSFAPRPARPMISALETYIPTISSAEIIPAMTPYDVSARGIMTFTADHAYQANDLNVYFNLEPVGTDHKEIRMAFDNAETVTAETYSSVVTNTNCAITMSVATTNQAWHQVIENGVATKRDLQRKDRQFTGNNGECPTEIRPVETTNPNGGAGPDKSFDSVWYLCMIRYTYVNGVEVSAHVLYCNQM